MRDGARHAGLAEGRRELASDLYWRYRGVVKAGENKAGHLLGTFEYQPSLVGTRLPNREGVIGTSLVIRKLRLVRIDMPASLANTLLASKISFRWAPAANDNALLSWQRLPKVLDDNNRLTKKCGSTWTRSISSLVLFAEKLSRESVLARWRLGQVRSGEGNDEGGESWGRYAETWLVRRSVDSCRTVFANHHPD